MSNRINVVGRVAAAVVVATAIFGLSACENPMAPAADSAGQVCMLVGDQWVCQPGTAPASDSVSAATQR